MVQGLQHGGCVLISKCDEMLCMGGGRWEVGGVARYDVATPAIPAGTGTDQDVLPCEKSGCFRIRACHAVR